MNTVYKYAVDVKDDQMIIEMPKNAIILSAHVQNNEAPCIWALCDINEKEIEQRKIIMRGTGHPIFEDIQSLSFIGTCILQNGAIVFHLFEKIK